MSFSAVDDGDVWLDLCRVSPSLSGSHQPFSVVRFRIDTDQLECKELMTTVLRLLPPERDNKPNNREDDDDDDDDADDDDVDHDYKPSLSLDTIRLHPLLLDFFCQVMESIGSSGTIAQSSTVGDVTRTVLLLPFPVETMGPEPFSRLDLPFQGIHIEHVESSRVKDLPESATVHLTLLYTEAAADNNAGIETGIQGEDNDETTEASLVEALVNRYIAIGSTVALAAPGGDKWVAVVSNIVTSSSSSDSDEEEEDLVESDRQSERTEQIYRVGLDVGVALDGSNLPTSFAEQIEPSSTHKVVCPGYETLATSVMDLLFMDGAGIPSGILLTGCAGVGKSTLAKCVGQQQGGNGAVHWVDCQDLLLRASISSEQDLFYRMMPPRDAQLVILDDLYVLETADEASSVMDSERMVVRNAILTVLDELSNQGHSRSGSCRVLGIARDASLLPKELVRIHRLEKVVEMLPPSQAQREVMLMAMLTEQGREQQDRGNTVWARPLSMLTAGFVAADMCRLLADALAFAEAKRRGLVWNDLAEAARRSVPSQLRQLDVTKTPAIPDELVGSDPYRVHEWAWQDFAGYNEMKQGLYRTVVSPWRRAIAGLPPLMTGVEPPGGVLFHGPPGVGKTFAAGCLATSLGLHVIRVRAADVLDQWLGGSEAAIRSLFARARSASPCILFFDEIDAIATNREEDGSENDVSSRILSTFLNEMDGVSSKSKSSDGVLVVGCTNRLHALDAALLRPGRLDEHVHLPIPQEDDILAILRWKLRNVPLSSDVDNHLPAIASALHQRGSSGADVEALCRDACSTAIRLANGPDTTLTVSILEQTMTSTDKDAEGIAK